jgi:polysaccharide export outer membrane protein
VEKLILTRRGMVVTALPLAGCAGFLPESGPKRGEVMSGASIQIGDFGDHEKLAYALVKVSADTLQRLAPFEKREVFSGSVTNTIVDGGVISVGDVVSITIFEAGAGGLFIPAEPGTRSGNFVNLPPQEVDRLGNIIVPFAGTLHIVGLSTQAVSILIQRRIADRAIDPQVMVTITDRRANAVTVTGDVNSSTRFILALGGERLLGAIARAGGPKYPPYESLVTLQRGNTTERALIAEIMRDPRQNAQLRGGDTVFVSRSQRYFLALGALGPGQYLGLVNRRLAFEDSQLSLADAIAKVGGLSDDRANPRAVFIYRSESRETLAYLGATTRMELPPVVPTIYYLDLAAGAGYFFAREFSIRNEDLIYVSNAPATDLAKFLALLLPTAYSAASFKVL